MGAANFGIPFLIAIYTTEVHWLILSLVVSRGLALWVYRILARSCIRDLLVAHPSSYSPEIARKLIKFGGWFTLSSVLNPVVASADRFYIASVVSAAAVTAYVIPYEMAAQSLIIVGAVTTVAFPFLSQLRVHDSARAKKIFYKMLGVSLGGMFFVAVCYFFLGGFVLTLWLGKVLSPESRSVIEVLSFGLVPYTIGTMCISLLHADGKTDTTAKINLIEFPFFLALIYFCILHFGAVGAAYAWVIRVSVDAVLLVYFCLKLK
ncbi:polysaccharide biosynthesis C-terminal domain-containing protein [Cupriavidus basilensis]|uniref:oligosaccharide flippase family protein n=1 Tax=Cupriavidus basilensis TaxID=68895 RepID=UPI001ED9286B|nr:polysaccharide biosynthesis C-terminal domain-containing protein [Cupriavidus basilensis]